MVCYTFCMRRKSLLHIFLCIHWKNPMVPSHRLLVLIFVSSHTDLWCTTETGKKKLHISNWSVLCSWSGSISISGQLPPYPSPNPTLTLTCCRMTVVDTGQLSKKFYLTIIFDKFNLSSRASSLVYLKWRVKDNSLNSTPSLWKNLNEDFFSFVMNLVLNCQRLYDISNYFCSKRLWSVKMYKV